MYKLLHNMSVCITFAGGIHLRRPAACRRVSGISLHIEKGVYWRFVFDAQKASNTFNKITGQRQSKQSDAYGYDLSCRVCRFSASGLSYRRRFHCCLL